MNLLLLLPSDLVSQNTVSISGRRCDHINTVLKADIGDLITAGWVNGNIGKARVIDKSEYAIRLDVSDLNQGSLAPLPVILLLALPRPRVLHRLLQTCTTLGVAEIHLLQTARVEKSYWQTPLLKQTAIAEQLHLGLEQAKTTVMPTVHFHQRFVPFIEDELPQMCTRKRCVVAHPVQTQTAVDARDTPTVLAIGPEGGFQTGEVERLYDLGFAPMSLGPRILKVETAVPVALAKLFN